WSMAGLWNSKHFPLYSHTMLVVGPEHARTFADGGWSKDDLKRHLHETVRRPYRTLLPDADHGEGTNLRYGKDESVHEPDAMVSKFQSTEEIHVVVAGGTAGRFSVAIPGWLGTKNGSRPVTRLVEQNISIDLLEVACHSTRRFWHKRSQVTIVRDRDTRRAGPVRAAFLFALQFRRVTPPRWREHRGLKTP